MLQGLYGAGGFGLDKQEVLRGPRYCCGPHVPKPTFITSNIETLLSSIWVLRTPWEFGL